MEKTKPAYLSSKTVIIVVILLLVLLSLLSISVGKFQLEIKQVFQALFFSEQVANQQASHIIWQLRLPRLFAAILIGSALASAGAVYQVMFRNPLVSPDILGVSAGAGLGATIAIYLGLNLFFVEFLAFGSGLMAVLTVYFISRSIRKHDPVLVMVLAGVAVSSILGACISFIKIMADPYTQLSTITFWLLGGLNTITADEIYYTLPIFMVGLIPIILLRWRVDLLNLSDEDSLALGLDLSKIRLILIISATLITSSAVAIAGIIGWVGLIIPHIARLIIGPKFTQLLLVSILLGACFLVVSDTLSRVIAPIDLPLSILTSFIGAPFFILLLMRRDKKA